MFNIRVESTLVIVTRFFIPPKVDIKLFMFQMEQVSVCVRRKVGHLCVFCEKISEYLSEIIRFRDANRTTQGTSAYMLGFL